MVNKQNFIANKLQELAELIPDIKIRYEYRYGYLHLIEILPLEIFNDSIDYFHKEIEIEQAFDKQFDDVDDELLFISSDSLNEIKTPILTIGY